MTNSINWKKREVIKNSQSAWYDHTFYKVPYTGIFDASKISKALTDRFTRQFLGNFGGQTHIGDVSDLGNGFAEVEWLRSIGH